MDPGPPRPAGDAGDRPAAAAPTFAPERVREQVRRIEHGLTRVLFGDYTAVISLEDPEPLWGNLAMHINVVINAARNAIRRAEESERQAALDRDRALAAAAAESKFLTNVTHELRTPLASIRASAEILRDYGAGDPAVVAEFAPVIVSESERLTRLIENVLDLSRLEANKAPWRPNEVSLAEVVQSAVASLQPLAMRLSVSLCCAVLDPPPASIADRDGVTQVVVNLVSNALKFSPAGKSVKVVVHYRADADAVLVDVRDQGPGIPADQLAVVFERFRQVAGDILTEKPAGTGLGLAIAREIVTRHGGTIAVESELGVGSTFRMTLPVLRRVEDWDAADGGARSAPVGAAREE